MSLFGGDDSAPVSHPQYESETEHLQPSEPSSPSVDGIASPPNAQQPSERQVTTDLGHEEDVLTDSLSGSDESGEEQPTRPNRFRGRPEPWKTYTAADRQIAASLEQTQNKDLAAHLFNTHALKRRVRRPAKDLAKLSDWQTREHWLKRGNELDYTDVSGEVLTELVPSKDWTAWPLPPTRIPTHREQSDGFVGGDDEEWSIGGTHVHDAGEEMREELLATFVRLAKEQWNARPMDDAPPHKRDHTTLSRSRSQSKSAPSTRSASRADVHSEDDDHQESENAEIQDEDEQERGHTVAKRRGKPPQPKEFSKPAFLVDDERALRILQPTIHSVLSKLDDLALAVRHTRLNHFGRGADSDTSSRSEYTTGAESGDASSRPPSRAQMTVGNTRKRNARHVSRATSAQIQPALLKARIEAQNGLLDSDTDSGSDSSTDLDTVKNAPASRKPSRPRSSTAERTPSIGRDDTFRLGLMDWSEVLGLAAAKGWDESAISRTAQRCAALFGESMSFVPLEEDLAMNSTPQPVQYTPSTIPAPPSLSRRSGPSKRPYLQAGTLRCPHLDCFGHEKEFEAPHRFVEHIVRVHGYDPRTNDSDNEERTVGGVHIDGFLQPVAAPRSKRVRSKSRAGSERRMRMGEPEESGDAGDPMVVDSD